MNDWNGFEVFLSGEEGSSEWLHFVSNNKLEAVEEHEDAVSQTQDYFQAYMMAYGEESFDLINPSTKYGER